MPEYRIHFVDGTSVGINERHADAAKAAAKIARAKDGLQTKVARVEELEEPAGRGGS